MSNLNRIIFQWLAVFLVSIIIITIWMVIVIPEVEKLSKKDLLDREYEGEEQIVDNIYGNMSKPFGIIDKLSQKIIDENGNEITIESTLSSKRVDTNNEIFHVDNIYKVDAVTLMHIDKKGKRYGFSPGVEKKDYDFFHPAIFYDSSLVFKKTDSVNGLGVYVFESIIKQVDTSNSFPQFKGHTIFTDSISRLYVEPITGNTIQFEKEWESYLVEEGKRINTIDMGEKHTREYTKLVLIQFTQEKIENIRFYTIVMPIFLIVLVFGIGVILILLSYLGRIKRASMNQEKLALIGDMTAKLSHDLRNPLTIVKNGIELMQIGLAEERKEENMKRIQNAVDRISYEIESIMDFVRGNPLSKEIVSLRKIIDLAIENIKIPQKITVEKEIPDIIVDVDKNQMIKVFSNILKNSVEVMHQGKITISTKIKTKTIEIEFADSGPGIPKDKIDKIFEPLFTTKQKGTGLGLASCKTLIEKHGGHISVKNDPTRFTIILPR
ncbi:MAG: porin PorA family protein [Nitrosarchaeum sp.]|nr:porin PorA family protein [Nitrosarchaeum sp.]